MRAERLFRRLLKLFPAHCRGDFGDEMADVFRECRDVCRLGDAARGARRPRRPRAGVARRAGGSAAGAPRGM